MEKCIITACQSTLYNTFPQILISINHHMYMDRPPLLYIMRKREAACDKMASVYDDDKRMELMKRYHKLQQFLKARNRRELLQGITFNDTNARTFAPIIQSNDRITRQLKRQLKRHHERDEGDAHNETITPQEEEEEGEEEEEVDAYNDVITQHEYIKRFFDIPESQTFPRADDIDKTFGIIRGKEGQYKIAGKTIETSDDEHLMFEDGSHIEIDSPGLWNLIMLKKPTASMYNTQDIQKYHTFLRQVQMGEYIWSLSKTTRTKVMHFSKWTDIIQPLIEGDDVRPATPPPTPQSSKTPHSIPITRVTRSSARQTDSSSGRGLCTCTPRKKVKQAANKSGKGIEDIWLLKHLLNINIAKAMTRDMKSLHHSMFV